MQQIGTESFRSTMVPVKFLHETGLTDQVINDIAKAFNELTQAVVIKIYSNQR
jgi:hypothetical protein